ncbi:HupH hydrogenase expression protein [Gluconacetobacter johannae DSM 13595]|uniref:Hydrogenase expression/formation protein n=1 Tax=Gluconacetobacter johannae TaxID=112140 RepID=A0A7W4J8J7_9PROT|nr:hydrogenase expression/formation protein [Gluconacetobacter johannae]MBB2176686.1 hydrogenase expression/formation protein [Gluconacetobacter johannae]GBQ91338.1 HupH hydrogenase expression protein [Gluconacetobacter johannae DSM 13595]
MSASFAFPPIGFGPGSTPPEGEDGLQYLAMPSGVSVYAAHLPEIDDPAQVRPALAFLTGLRDMASQWVPGLSMLLKRDGLDAATRAVADDALGEGEVSVLLEDAAGRIEVQETVFAGVWTLRALSPDPTQPAREQMEIGAFPRAVLARAFPARPAAAPDLAALATEGVVNAPAILTELLDRSAAWHPGRAAHVVNLSLLPHTPEDLELIARVLGRGGVTILSRGYGNCRIEATATPHVWRVRYFNSMDTLILDTIEVAEVPEIACAAREDIADSATRLAEICAALAGPDA